MAAIDQDQRIPVTLLTGFLGSGKTSLLNRWLADASLADTAVIVNELGEIGIDHALIASSNENTIELSTGCLCCTVSGDLVDTLRDLYVRRSTGEIRAFTRVLIETTGMADPAPVIQMLMTQPATLRYRLCDVITTIDAVHGERTLDAHAESVKQVAVADKLVVTKMELLAGRPPGALEARLRSLNPGAPRYSSTLADWPGPALLLGDQGHKPGMGSSQAAAWLNLASFESAPSSDEETPSDDTYRRYVRPAGPAHDAGIASFVLRFDRPIEWEQLAAWLDALTIAHPTQLLRVKGIFSIAGRSRPVAVHAVQSLFHPPTELDAWPDGDRQSRVVFITKDLSRAYVEEVLEIILSRAQPTRRTSEPLEH